MAQRAQPTVAPKAATTDRRGQPIISLLAGLLALLLLVGCQSTPAPADTASVTIPTEESTTTVSAPDTSGESSADSVATELTTVSTDTVSSDTVSAGETMPPVRLAIPSIDFATEVVPMAWRVTEVEGERQAVWEVPEASAGWHINSATVGAAGNMLISGHHREGTAVFAPLARGEVVLDDQIYVTDSAGRTFIYQVSEIADPIPMNGASSAELDRLNAYQAPSTTAKLTLLTGWPDFSDTHYLIVVADLVGELE